MSQAASQFYGCLESSTSSSLRKIRFSKRSNSSSGISSAVSISTEECSSMYLFTQNLMKYLGLSKARSFSSMNSSTLLCQSLLNEWVRYSAMIITNIRKYLKSATRYTENQNILKNVMNISDI